MLPVRGAVEGGLAERAIEVLERSSALGAALPGALRQKVIERVRAMNSYYSNLIEGHPTHPLDIDRALAQDLSEQPRQRALQLESLAHIEVQKLIERRLATEERLAVCSPSFIQWIHAELYVRMPDEFRVLRHEDRELPVVPGELRTVDVAVGRHVPPRHSSLPAFLERFAEAYDPDRLTRPMQLVAACAAHHRLAWIHPFVDGNGRVTRLHTEACLSRMKLGGHGLWTMSRGLARRRADYMSALTWADAPRQGDLDGRGVLSLSGLERFCDFLLRTALEQIDFMAGLVDLTWLGRRIEVFVDRQVAAATVRPEARHVLLETLRAGEISRGDAARVSGLGERVARELLGTLLSLGLLASPSPKGPVQLGLPAWVLPDYFPNLFPTDIEEDLRRTRPPPQR